MWVQSSTDPGMILLVGTNSQNLTHGIRRGHRSRRGSPNAGGHAEVVLPQPFSQAAQQLSVSHGGTCWNLLRAIQPLFENAPTGR